MEDGCTPPDPHVATYNTLKEAVQNGGDFDDWTKLLTAAEKVGDGEKLLQVYDEFLTEYPLCYGYWSRYSVAVGGHGGDRATIFERGVQAIPHSVDLWLQYIEYFIGTGADEEKVRALFERALKDVGSDFLSHNLWDKYIAYEHGQQATVNISHLYVRIMGMPIQQLDRFYQR